MRSAGPGARRSFVRLHLVPALNAPFPVTLPPSPVNGQLPTDS
jgi:hypothetical protein